MNPNTRTLIPALFLAIGMASGNALADQHETVKERRIVIQTSATDASGAQKNMDDIMAEVEREIGDDSNANVMVTVDDNGKVLIRKLTPGETLPIDDGKNMEHEIIMHKMHGGPMPHMQKIGGKHMSSNKSPMSKEAATCVLKNISKASTDAAARLVRQACSTLNPAN